MEGNEKDIKTKSKFAFLLFNIYELIFYLTMYNVNTFSSEFL